MAITKLKKLDFTTGIKAEDIDSNFELVYEWLRRERLRLGGWGLVEGFALSGDTTNFTVAVGSGLLINEDGDEVSCDRSILPVGPPESIAIADEVFVSEEGNLTLRFCPYSDTKYGFINYNPPYNNGYPDRKEISITECESGSNVPIYSIVENNVSVSASDWAGKKVTINYRYTKNRIDSILIHKNGTYKYEKGILSSSPSHVDFEDYDNYYIIGVAYWTVADKVSVEFFTDNRTYRKVYVDELNRLYLNGKLYAESKFIHFTEPDFPQKNDVWYDKETNSLYVWLEENGVYGWQLVNDHSSNVIRIRKIWQPGTGFPTDYQSFLFDEDETDLRFLPNTNALEVIIDNAPLMSDQFTEIVMQKEKDYLNDGIGFKLIEPLDHEAHVEVVVHHFIKSGPLRETFQRAAVFVSENYTPHNSLNLEQLFTTSASYVVGENQLEVFVNGIRLIKNVDFIELTKDGSTASSDNNGEISESFKVLAELASGDYVAHKVTRHVWSYDHLDLLVGEIKNKATDALAACAQLQEDLSAINANVTQNLTEYGNKLSRFETALGQFDDCLKKDEVISKEQLPKFIKDRICSDSFSIYIQSTEPLVYSDIKINDYLQIMYCRDGKRDILIKDVEYSVVALDGSEETVQIVLRSDLINSEAFVYIYGFRCGVD